MSEHKRKSPGQIKGQEYRKGQNAPVRVRVIRLEKIKATDHKWARRHGVELKSEVTAGSGADKKEE